MKTIRSNTFETNSSSTHSITIMDIDDVYSIVEGYDNVKLIEDISNVITFYPKNIVNYKPALLYDNGDHHIICANTVDTKAAMLCMYIAFHCAEKPWVGYTCPVYVEEVIDHLKNKLKSILCVDEIDMNISYYETISTFDDDDFLDVFGKSLDDYENMSDEEYKEHLITSIDKFIKDVVMNKTVKLIDNSKDD